MMRHLSDCAVHNAPALPVGPCDCGAEQITPEMLAAGVEVIALHFSDVMAASTHGAEVTAEAVFLAMLRAKK